MVSLDTLRARLENATAAKRLAETEEREAERDLTAAIMADLAERGIEAGRTVVRAFDRDDNLMTLTTTRGWSSNQKTTVHETFGVGYIARGQIWLSFVKKDGTVGTHQAHKAAFRVEKV